jgi:hypothetical protein
MTSSGSAAARPVRDRAFFTTMAAIILVVIFIGFAPSYYLRGILPAPHPYEPISPVVMLHGLVFSAWVILFGIQASLVATNRVAVHRQLGKVGMVLIAIMIPLAIITALQGVDRPFSRPPGIPGLTWLAVPLLDVPVFGGLIVAALAFRRTPAIHKRLMLIGMIDLLQPALGRIPDPAWLPLALSPLQTLVFLVPLFVWDLVTLKRIHPATLCGSAILAVVMFTVPLIWTSPAWLAFAGWAHGLIG